MDKGIDRRVLRVEKRALWVEKLLLRVDKRVLLVLRVVKQVLRVTRRFCDNNYPELVSSLMYESKIAVLFLKKTFGKSLFIMIIFL